LHLHLSTVNKYTDSDTSIDTDTDTDTDTGTPLVGSYAIFEFTPKSPKSPESPESAESSSSNHLKWRAVSERHAHSDT